MAIPPSDAQRTEAAENRVDLRIQGLHCAGCVATVERALRAVPGVRSASVNLATNRATVATDGTIAGVERLAQAVRDAGYDAELLTTGTTATAPPLSDSLRSQWRSVVLAWILGAPLVIVHLAHWLPGLPAAAHQFMAWWMGTPAGWAVQGVLAVAVLVAGARGIIGAAVRALLRGTTTMDVLVALGALTALASGVVGTVIQNPELVNFESAAMIVMFVALGKYFEARARGAASAALRGLAARIPREATRVVGDQLQTVPVDDVQPGDHLRVGADALVPVDGEVIGQAITIDESILTGEALPVERKAGEKVFGGTRVAAGVLDLRATAIGAESAAARIARLVEEAQATKPPWQRLADKLAGVFVPVILILALLAGVGWLIAGGSGTWALQRAIAVLVVACPCALGLAIPTAVLVGTTRAAERGILVRDPTALEVAAHVREVLLDKTGTLTLGRPTLVRIHPTEGERESDLLALAASLEQLSAHPFARAIVPAARERGVTLTQPADFESRPGGGLRGRLDGHDVLVGSAGWLRECGVDTPALTEQADALASQGLSVVAVARDKRLAGFLGLADPLHPESADAVAELHRLGVRTRILSGDRHAAVSRVAGLLGIDAFEAQLGPAEKLERVRAASKQHGAVAVVGDGVNDAPALAAADVGIAIGTGADVARQAAPICLAGHSPRLIPMAIRISRASARIMKQNLAWAAGYNLVMLPVAAFTPISPALATAAMMCSSLSVVANSLRLRRAV